MTSRKGSACRFGGQLWFSCFVLLSILSLSAPSMMLAGGGPAPWNGVAQYGKGAVDGAGNLFVTDEGLGLVRRISPGGMTTIVAGVGIPGFSGDGGPATRAQIEAVDVAIDAAGNLFIAGRAVVRKVTPAGVISTVAGMAGRQGYTGDGGPATSARIFATCVAIDPAGSIIFGGTETSRGGGGGVIRMNSVVRKVAPDGIITTIAGTGGNRSASSGDGGPATSAQIFSVWGIALDSVGNLFIADGDRRVRKVSPAGIISTVAGAPAPGVGADTRFSGDGGPALSAQLYAPSGVAIDNAGNLFIADFGNGRIRKLVPAGIITTIAGPGSAGVNGDGGPATSAQLSGMFRIAVDGAGNLYIFFAKAIRKVSPDGIISTIPVTIASASPSAAHALAGIASSGSGAPVPWPPVITLMAVSVILAAKLRKP